MNGVRAKVAIVEDEAIVAMDIKMRLQSVGFKVLYIVNDADSLFIKMKKELPDIILMDIIIKGNIDGIRAARQVKELYNLPVIYITAHADETTFQRAKITEPYGYIVKPIDFKDLFNTIEIALYRHKMEKELLLSELKYRTLILTATDSVLTLDENGIITAVNPKTIDLFQYDEEEILGQSIKCLLPDTFINHLESGAKRFLNVGKPLLSDHLELEAKRKDKSHFPVEISFSQWHVEDTSYFTLIIRDISARKQIELDLRRAKEQLEQRVRERTAELKSLIDESPLPIRMFDSAGRLTYQNDVSRGVLSPFLGYKNDGEYTLFTDPFPVHYGIMDSLKKIMREGGAYSTPPLFFDTGVIDQQPMEDKIFLFRYYSLVDSGGSVHRIVNIVEDLTEHYKAREFSRELLEKKTISTAIFGKLEDERTRISRELHDSVGQILSAAKFNLEVFERLNNESHPSLTKAKTLLASAGAELRNIIYSIHPVVLTNGNIFDSIEAHLAQFAKSTGIEVMLDCSLNSSGFLPEFNLHLYRIIQEAINNILKHAAATKVEVCVNTDNIALNLFIKDNGSGFELPAKSKDDRHSFGFLNMKERTSIFDGTFSVESGTGHGTIISISFPLENIREKNKADIG